MHQFGYAEQGESSEGCSQEWLQEQQEKFNFARYKELDQSQVDLFKTLNMKAVEQVLQGNLKEKVYVLNLDKEKQLSDMKKLPTYPDIVKDCSMKEVPQLKK